LPKHKFSLVACARWEEKDILEWIDYHRLIGVDHIEERFLLGGAVHRRCGERTVPGPRR